MYAGIAVGTMGKPYDIYDVEMIIANQNNTGIYLNSNLLTTINQGQIYVVTSLNDMTGRHITTNKPVAYFTSNQCALVPGNRAASDILFEQLMSVDRWGTQFLVPSALSNVDVTMNNHIRIIASQNGTIVNYSGADFFQAVDVQSNPYSGGGPTNFSSGGTLNAGQWVELEITGTVPNACCYISTNKPVGVADYMVGSVSASYLGDPSIAWVPPLNQSMQSVTISPFMFPQGTANTAFGLPDCLHSMLIITPTDTRGQTTVNGAPVPAGGWIDTGVSRLSGYSYYWWDFDNTADVNKIFTVANPAGVLVFAGGFAQAESYYYNAGSGACVFN